MSVPEGRQSMIVTANIEFSKWVTVFGDDKMAAKNSKPLRLLLAQELCIFAKEKQNRGVNAYADVNSYD